MSNYLVTGAAGFIGSRVSEMLIEQGHAVTGVDNLNDAYDVRMKEYRLRKLQALPGFEFVKADISDRTDPQSSINNLQSTIRRGHQPGSPRRGAGQRRESLGLCGYQRHRHAEPARILPATRASGSSSWLPPPASMGRMRPIPPRKPPTATTRCSRTPPARKPPRRSATATTPCTGWM